MRRLFFCLVLVLCMIGQRLDAQITVGDTPDRYYVSMQDFMLGECVETPYLAEYYYDGDGLIRFNMDDRALRKALRRQARVVVHQDSLLLNLRHLSYQGFDLGSGYAQAWQLNDSTLLFFAPDAGWKAFGKEFGIALGTAVLTLGLTGGMGYAAVFVNGNWACYTYSGPGHKVQRINREAAQALLDEYNPLLGFDFKAESAHNQKQKITINSYMYRMVHDRLW